MTWYASHGKRALDIVGSAALLAISIPIQLTIAVAVVAVHGRPVLFVQDRPGLGGTVFQLRKFRSMRIERHAGEPDGDRLTRLGRFLRATSLDELPTLLNVLKGDMSIVGPRPLLVQYLPLYTQDQARRHEVRPGVTGLAQVSGRNALSWEDKFAFDVEYVDHLSLTTDARILIQTFVPVLKRSGVSALGHATTAPFRGRGGSA
jgi:lipopolysaccharide/colanic/teichoic acid biosynthesis glycosyltransferase